MSELTVTAVGEDRPGIVAAVTEVLYQLGCNLADCSMSLLRDQFAMILLVEAPEGLGADRVRSGLMPVADDLRLALVVRDVSHTVASPAGHPFVLSVYGKDRPGLVFAMAKVLASRNVNIRDLMSRAAGDIYTTIMDIDLPGDVSADSLESQLQEAAAELGLEVSLRPSETTEL